jgi:phage gp29-like protein
MALPKDLRLEYASDDPAVDVTRAYLGNIRYNEDKLLRSLGGNLDVYEDVYRDDRVRSCLQQRIGAVTANDYDIVPGGDSAADIAAADAAKTMIESIGFDHLTEKVLLQSLLKGFCVAEIIWSVKDGLYWPAGVKVKRSQRFMFAPLYLTPPRSERYDDVRQALRLEPSLRLKTRRNLLTGEPLPARKAFVHHVAALDDDNPYGTGLGFWLYWPVRFKREGMSLWLQFIDKFGSPSLKGTYPNGATEADKRVLMDALRALRSNSVTAVPEGMAAELMDAARTGITSHEQLIERMDQAITTVILSQTLTTTQGQRGSQALGTVHETIKDEVAKSDADALSDTINETLLTWFTQMNFATAKRPRLRRDMSEVENLGDKATRDKTLADAAAMPLDQTYVEEEYNIKLSGKPATAAASFAEAGEAGDAVSHASGQLEREAAPITDAMIAQARQLLDEAGDLTEFAEKLPALLGEMDTAALNALMTKAFSSMELAGRYAVQHEQ